MGIGSMKQLKRAQLGLCRGCGKNPCVCKHKGNQSKANRNASPRRLKPIGG